MGYTATFIGHRECFEISKEIVEENIIKLIEQGYDEFLNGAMGAFDRLCAKCVSELKKDYPHIKNVVVIPYLSFRIECSELFDEVVYPEGFEKYHFKSAIIKRNRYLIDNSSAAVCYVKNSWGGAAQTFNYATKSKNYILINLAK